MTLQATLELLGRLFCLLLLFWRSLLTFNGYVTKYYDGRIKVSLKYTRPEVNTVGYLWKPHVHYMHYIQRKVYFHFQVILPAALFTCGTIYVRHFLHAAVNTVIN